MKLACPPFAALLFSTVAATSIHAQTLKPGLWEMSTQIKSASGEIEKAMADMQKQMAAMPPEQRKMMQDMMAKQGVNIGTGTGGGTQVKLCLTREMIERNEIAGQQPGDCKTTQGPRTGNSMKISFVCTRPASSGEGEVRFAGPEAYSSSMTVRTTARGKEETMSMQGQGKWLGTACGDIKPIGTK